MSFSASRQRRFSLFLLLQVLVASAATFGTLVPIRGTAGDLALDERRGRLYVASLASYRIESISTQDRTLGQAFQLAKPPSALALSPDNRFLVAGLYDNFTGSTAPGGLSIFDMDADNRRTDIALPNPVLAVAFGSGSRALVITTANVFLLDPLTAVMEPISVASLTGGTLPVAFGTFPQKITNATLNVSGDGNTIMGVADGGGTFLIRYRVGETAIALLPGTYSPALGPRSISVNADATRFVAGWVLFDSNLHSLGEFPSALGDIRAGGTAFDHRRDAIYAQVPAAAKEAPVMHVVDTDNLTVRERIQLPQSMAGRSVFSSDMETLYSLSDSGVLILPVGRLASQPRVVTSQPDILFLGDACNRRVITQFLDLADPNGASVDFTLSLPANISGVRLSATSGTTPARIRIDVDPTVFQNAKGTTTIPLTITSNRAVNVPEPVRLLVNTRDVNQRGRIVNVPGKIVDILTDRGRNRIYLLRQDKNIVQVHDAGTLRLLGNLRTGNTPVQMAMSENNRYLMVGNDHSQYISVFDLDTLEAAEPFWTPSLYFRSIAVGRGATWATARRADGQAPALFRLDLENRMASAPPSLGVFKNDVPDTSLIVASPSQSYVLLATPSGAVALWEADTNLWVVSRTDLAGLGGAYAAFNDNLFAIGPNLFDESLYPVASLTSAATAPTGFGLLGDGAVRGSAGVASAPGLIERFDINNRRLGNGTLTVEAPHSATSLLTPPVGQIGQVILPFTRTLAVAPDESAIFFVSQSGLSVIPANFDAAAVNPVVTSIVNSADGGAGIASGGLVTIAGNGLAVNSATASGSPLPSTLGDVCVTVSNIALPLFSVSPTRIAAQLPFNVAGAAPMIVRTPGGISAPFTVNVASGAPAIFRSGTAGDQTGLPLVIRQKNNEILNFTNPVHPGEGISILLTGLGRTSPEPNLGESAPGDPLAIATQVPTVTIGNTPLQIDFAGLVPGQIGVYQINATVPGSVTDAAQTPLTIKQGTISTAIPVRVVTP